ncbi:MAG: Uncharacterized protein JWR37_6226 [Mycobacterium sp.]|nr:Uncharacterized protein [Mycobacterium sp.]
MNEIQVDNREDYIVETYRYLRGSIVVMIIMLAVSVIAESIAAKCLQPSISAYYFTSVHSIFVASLCAIGILLIAYKGSKDTEDILLDLVGIMAFVVAMVPTGRPEKDECAAQLPSDYPITEFVQNNVLAVIIALLIGKGLARLIRVRKDTPKVLPPYAVIARALFWAVVVVGAIAFFAFGRVFEKFAHGVAAFILFIVIIVVVFLNAYLAAKQTTTVGARDYPRIYRCLGWLMIFTIAAVGALHIILNQNGSKWDLALLVLETALIIEFAVYWAFQTVELWSHADRNPMLPKDDPQLEKL